MPKYVIFRSIGEVSEEEMEASALRSLQALDQMLEVRWVRSYYSAEEGKIYCEYEAPSVDLLYEHARHAGLPLDYCTVVQELEPAMFR